jgi:hypothetical protein
MAAGRKKRVGRYEVGRTIGQGTFAKVKFAVDADTGAAVAMKVLDKDTILNHRMLHQVIPPLLLSRYPPHPPPPVHESKSNSSHSPLCFDPGDSFYTFFYLGALRCCFAVCQMVSSRASTRADGEFPNIPRQQCAPLVNSCELRAALAV